MKNDFIVEQSFNLKLMLNLKWLNHVFMIHNKHHTCITFFVDENSSFTQNCFCLSFYKEKTRFLRSKYMLTFSLSLDLFSHALSRAKPISTRAWFFYWQLKLALMTKLVGQDRHCYIYQCTLNSLLKYDHFPLQIYCPPSVVCHNDCSQWYSYNFPRLDLHFSVISISPFLF